MTVTHLKHALDHKENQILWLGLPMPHVGGAAIGDIWVNKIGYTSLEYISSQHIWVCRCIIDKVLISGRGMWW